MLDLYEIDVKFFRIDGWLRGRTYHTVGVPPRGTFDTIYDILVTRKVFEIFSLLEYQVRTFSTTEFFFSPFSLQ